MPEALSLGRMAARLRVPRDWLRERADSGAIPCLKAGRQYFFCPPAVLEALARLASRAPGGEPRGGATQGDPDGLKQLIEPTADPEGSRGQTGPREPVSLQ